MSIIKYKIYNDGMDHIRRETINILKSTIKENYDIDMWMICRTIKVGRS